jgi:WD40 repeat protein
VAQWQRPDFQDPHALFEIGTSDQTRLGFSTVRFAPSGRLLATVLSDGVVQVWDVRQRALHREFKAYDKTVFPAQFVSQERRVVLLYPDDSLREWDIASGQQTQSWRGLPRLSAVAFSPDERWCLMFGLGGASLLRDMETGHQMDPELDLGTQGTARSTTFSPDGRLFAAATWSNYVRVWDTATPKEVATLRRFLAGAHSVAFTPEGTRLAAGSSEEETIKLWAMDNYEEVLTLETQESRFICTAFSPDGSMLGSLSSEGFLHLWCAPSWEEIEAQEHRGK